MNKIKEMWFLIGLDLSGKTYFANKFVNNSEIFDFRKIMKYESLSYYSKTCKMLFESFVSEKERIIIINPFKNQQECEILIANALLYFRKLLSFSLIEILNFNMSEDTLRNRFLEKNGYKKRFDFFKFLNKEEIFKINEKLEILNAFAKVKQNYPEITFINKIEMVK